MRVRILLALTSIVICLPLQAREEAGRNWALLIGVSEYPSLAPERQLRGPRNDVAAMEQVLKTLTPTWSGIHIIADGVPNAEALPTREAIVSAFVRLRRDVRPGDFVVIYFSGHGSQQPALSGDESETDRLVELFLPRDIGRWSGQAGTVRNALTDDQLNGLLAPLLAMGARIWAIFDTCHSGTITRGLTARTTVTESETARLVPPDELGVPSTSLAARSMRLDVRPSWAEGLVVFSAAHSEETTPELRLPRGSSLGQQRGLFTYTLIDALQTSNATTFQQLAQFITSKYALARRVAPRPYFEGTLSQGLAPLRTLDSSQYGLAGP